GPRDAHVATRHSPHISLIGVFMASIYSRLRSRDRINVLEQDTGPRANFFLMVFQENDENRSRIDVVFAGDLLEAAAYVLQEASARSPTRPRRRGLSSLVGILFNSAPLVQRFYTHLCTGDVERRNFGADG